MNTFGHLFRVTTFGESHGGAVGVVIDGCPAGLKLDVKDFRSDLARRRTGQSSITSARKEADVVEMLSGVFEGKTIGSPIMIMVRNKDARPKDYIKVKNVYRPSHAYFTYEAKYGLRNWMGGGRASARETTARVLAGVVAKKVLSLEFGPTTPEASKDSVGSLEQKKGIGMEVLGYVDRVGCIGGAIDPMKVTKGKVEANIVRCPDARLAQEMIERIKEVQKQGDTIGGTVTCIIKNVPVGLGDPVFAKLKASLAQAMMSLPATMGVEFGSGFGSLGMLGSEHNDVFEPLNVKCKTKNVKIKTRTNYSGGIQGGISNGMPIVFRTVFKPVSTIFKEQETVTNKGKKTKLKMQGRHDPCVVPRAVMMVEAMAALVLVDAVLRQRAVGKDGEKD